MARSPSSKTKVPGTAAVGVPARSNALSLLISLRPGEWSKNLLVFAGLLFGKRLQSLDAVLAATLAFFVFCALSGAVYLVNDVLDRESDRRHPRKLGRPIASGALSVNVALAAASVLSIVSLLVAFRLDLVFGLIAAAYLAIFVLYSGSLKHIVIVDVLTIAIGFVLRAIAGAAVVHVEISHWLLVCTILLALFIALAKRRHELLSLADGATSHRPILGEYNSPYLLDQMMSVVTASTLMAYVFYTISPETQEKFGTDLLGLTIPFPLYGIFRYLYLVHRREGGGSPADLLLTDRPLLVCVALWALSVALIIYHPWFQ
jgi:4-hydroxybenzoate polyprenyltransferase